MNKYQPSQVQWSIYDFDDNEIDTTTLADGDYTVMQPMPNDREQYYTSDKTVTVADGRIDVRACQEAVADFLNNSGDWHLFIEAAWEGPEPNTITFSLGS